MFSKCTNSFQINRLVTLGIGWVICALDILLFVNWYGWCPQQRIQYAHAVTRAIPFILCSPFIFLFIRHCISLPEKKVLGNLTPASATFFKSLPMVNLKMMGQLRSLRVSSIKRLAGENPAELASLLHCHKSVAEEWVDLARTKRGLPPLERTCPPLSSTVDALHLKGLPAMDFRTCKILRRLGISSLVDLATEDAEELGLILECPVEDVQIWVSFAQKKFIHSLNHSPETSAPRTLDQTDLAREDVINETLPMME